MKAAGILFVTKAGKALFLRRSATAPDCPGCWDFPGGGQEGDESAEETAVRETREEIGFVPDGLRVIHTTTKSSSTLKGVAGPAPAAEIPVPAVGAEAAPPPGPPVLPLPELPPDVNYTTFLQKVGNEFTPELDTEHDGWSWAPIGAPPEPVHPGCRIALDRLSMNELDVARAIAEGRLTSPQKYENVWLFAIRFTGTGASYRPKLDEFVIRKAEVHQTPDALARLNGLPVIFKHPKKSLLDSKEFSNRIVGTVFLPYVAGDEVWAVAKIFVDEVAQMMSEGGLSTSPGVNFADFSVNARLTLEDGSKVLVEGDPSLYDHVAICQLGVWDKGGDPAGIRSESREDSAMADKDDEKREDARKDAEPEKKGEEKREDSAKKDAAKKDEFPEKKEEKKEEAKGDAAKADADAGRTLDKTLGHMLDGINSLKDSVSGLGKRMDALEGGEKDRKDAKRKDDDDEDGKEGKAKELAAADKSKKDSKRDDARGDARSDAAADSAITDRLAQVEKSVSEFGGKLPKDVPEEDHNALVDAQARADEVFCDFGKRAPRPLQQDTAASYERRCVRMLQDHSPTWKGKNLTTAFTDDASFSVVRDMVYKEARADAANPVNVPIGQLRMVEKKRDGHTIREFYGSPRDWMDPLAGPVQMRGTGTWKHEGLGSV